MNREDYIQASTTTRVYEKGLLDKVTFNRLLDSDNFEDFKRILAETKYSDAVNVIESRREFDKALDQNLVEMFKEFYKASKDPEVVEILASEYIFHNIKTVIKSHILKEDLTDLLMRITDYNYRGLYQELEESGRASKNMYFHEYINTALDEYEESKDPQRLDMTMDRLQNEYMLCLANRVGSPYIIEYVKNLIDAQNINMTLRGKRQNHRINCVYDFLIEGGNIPRDIYIKYYFEDMDKIIDELKKYDIYPTLLNSLDKWKEDDKLLHFREGAENFLDKIAIKGKYVTYGPEVLFSYMLRKEREIQIIRTIAVGKLNGLSPEDIKKRTGELIA